jgi:hypothetical protein
MVRFGEHVGLAFQLAVLVDHFQRAEQIVRGILRKREAVAARVDEAVFRGESVIEPVQFRLRLFLISTSEAYSSSCWAMSFCTQPRSSTMPMTRALAVSFNSGRTMREFSR